MRDHRPLADLADDLAAIHPAQQALQVFVFRRFVWHDRVLDTGHVAA